jgi:hypothetical protein
MSTTHNTFALAGRIAEQLGEGWTAKEGYQVNGSAAFVVGPNGEDIFLRTNDHRHKGKLVMSGSFSDSNRDDMPYDLDRGPELATTLTRKDGKDIAAVAAVAIVEKILPRHRAALVAIAEQRARNNDYASTCSAALADFLAITARRGLPRKTDREHSADIGRGVGNGGSIQVYQDTVEIELRLSHADALRVAAVLREIWDR